MKEREIIQKCIEALAEMRGDKDALAEHEAKHDRYASACEFQMLAKGVGMAIAKLEEMKAEST